MNRNELKQVENSLKRLKRLTPSDQVLTNIKRELGILETTIMSLTSLTWAAAVLIILITSNIYFLNITSDDATLASESLINDYTLYSL